MIDDVLSLSLAAGMRRFSERIAAKHRGHALVEGPADGFDPFGFAESGACTIEPNSDEYLQLTTSWDGTRGIDRPAHGAFDIGWEGGTLRLYWYTPEEHSAPYFALVATHRADAMRFFEAVCRWADQHPSAP
jgi:hypothetical protein